MKPLSNAALALVSSLLCSQLIAPPAWAQSPSTEAQSSTVEGSVSNSSMDGELFYELLIGEISLRTGEPGTGFSLLLDAARKTNDAALYQRAVDTALQSRSGFSALQAAKVWKAAQPQSREANRYVLQILVALNRIPETLEPLKTELAMAPATERALAIAMVPRSYAPVTDKKAAAALVEQALADYFAPTATAATAWTSAGRMRWAAGDAAGALEAVQRGQAADAADQGPALLALEMLGPKQPQAEALLQKYLASKPQIEVRMAYARSLLDAQRYSEASAQLQAVTQSKPDYPEAWLVLGSLQMQGDQLASAEASLKRYVELATQQQAEERARGLTQAYLVLAQIAEKRNNLPQASAWLDKIEDPQALISTQSRRAALLAKQGRMQDARKLITDLPERGPEDTRAKLNAEVQLLRDAKQYPAAYDLLAQAIAKEPQDSDLLYDQAMLAEKLDRLSEMEGLLRQVMQLKPEFPHAYNALGYSLAERNLRLPEAKTLIQKALQYAPGDPFISDSLAWVEFRLGNGAEALRLLEAAYKAKPDPEIAAHLGEVLWSLGQRDRATAVWKEGAQQSADNETLQATLKRLRVKL